MVEILRVGSGADPTSDPTRPDPTRPAEFYLTCETSLLFSIEEWDRQYTGQFPASHTCFETAPSFRFCTSFNFISFTFGSIFNGFTSLRFVSCCVVSFRFVSFRFVSFRFVSFRFVSFRFVSFRVVLCRFALFRFVSFGFVWFLLFRFVSCCFISFVFLFSLGLWVERRRWVAPYAGSLGSLFEGPLRGEALMRAPQELRDQAVRQAEGGGGLASIGVARVGR